MQNHLDTFSMFGNRGFGPMPTSSFSINMALHPMGAGGHRCIGSVGDFLAILDLLSNTAWSYYLLKHPKLHSNYSAGRRAMHHLPPYGGTRWWRAAPNSGLPRPIPSARPRLDAYKARRHSRCRCLSLISHLRVCRCCHRGHLREGGGAKGMEARSLDTSERATCLRTSVCA